MYDERVCDTRGSGIVSSTVDVLGMSMVRRMKVVGGVCEMCMFLSRGGVGGEWIVFGIHQSGGNSGNVGRVSVLGLRWCRWGAWTRVGKGVVVLCLCEFEIFV